MADILKNKITQFHNHHMIKFFTRIPLIALLCTACSAAPISEHSMNKYITQNYGSAELLKKEKGKKSITYFYKDNEYGFEYWIKSFSSGFTVDGSTFFQYESKDSNFEEQYYICLTKQLDEELKQLEKKYNVTISNTEIKAGGYTVKSFGLANIVLNTDNRNEAPEISQAVADLYLNKDSRNFWQEGSINVYSANNESLGYFDIHKAQYVTPEEDDAERFQIMAKQKDKSSQYQYCQTISMEEFLQNTGISPKDLQDKNCKTVTLYYFLTKSGKLYYIANVIYKGELFSTFE